jgi:NADPH-dependent 7-cyano-7-deazaguanine reductase QueF-like protein
VICSNNMIPTLPFKFTRALTPTQSLPNAIWRQVNLIWLCSYNNRLEYLLTIWQWFEISWCNHQRMPWMLLNNFTQEIQILMFIRLPSCSFNITDYKNLLLSWWNVWSLIDLRMDLGKQKFLKWTWLLLHKLLKLSFKWINGTSLIGTELLRFLNRKVFTREPLKTTPILKISRGLFLILMG